MQRVDTTVPQNWMVATKTKSIKAKPLVNLLVDRNVTNKFLVDTLEGKEVLGDGVMICIGEAMDAWQQMPKKLLAKYDIKAIDEDGWMICEPRPDNAVNCFEVTSQMTDDEMFYIIGHYGTPTAEGPRQEGIVGDYICQNREDLTDVWIVKRKLFINTYSVK